MYAIAQYIKRTIDLLYCIFEGDGHLVWRPYLVVHITKRRKQLPKPGIEPGTFRSSV